MFAQLAMWWQSLSQSSFEVLAHNPCGRCPRRSPVCPSRPFRSCRFRRPYNETIRTWVKGLITHSALRKSLYPSHIPMNAAIIKLIRFQPVLTATVHETESCPGPGLPLPSCASCWQTVGFVIIFCHGRADGNTNYRISLMRTEGGKREVKKQIGTSKVTAMHQKHIGPSLSPVGVFQRSAPPSSLEARTRQSAVTRRANAAVYRERRSEGGLVIASAAMAS